jgi:hyperosmotically inducible periplasmic protein
MKKIVLLLASMTLFAWGQAIAANQNQNQNQDQNQNQQQQSGKRGAGNQAWLVNEVHHQLVLLPYYSIFDNLEYKVEDDKVTLMGQVTRPSLKDDAGRAVKGIEGVEGVDNQIKVLPPSPMDDQIRRAEFQAIYSFPPLQKYGGMAVSPIHIIVDNGHVTLEGVVDNEADKDAANVRANGVPNVFSVTNNLRVQKSQ